MAQPAYATREGNKRLTGFAPKLILLLAGVALLMVSQLSTQATQTDTGAVQGTVSFGGSGDAAVAGAKVVLLGDTSIRSTVTDQDGNFAFRDLQPGIYLVEANYFGLHTEVNVKVETGSVAQAALQLDRAGAKR